MFTIKTVEGKVVTTAATLTEALELIADNSNEVYDSNDQLVECFFI